MTECHGRLFVLNTRPAEDSPELTRELQSRGISVICDPLISVRFFDRVPPGLVNVQALLFTSRNGVRAFINQSGSRNLPVFAVGDGTAQFARLQGFECVRSASGDVSSLVDLVLRVATPTEGKLIHVAGTVVAGDLAGMLGAHGFNVVREAMYEIQTADILSTRTVDTMVRGRLQGIVFFSPRTARVFVKLVQDMMDEDRLFCVSAYCLSPAVASVVESLPWKAVLSAKVPTMEAFLELFASIAEYEALNGE